MLNQRLGNLNHIDEKENKKKQALVQRELNPRYESIIKCLSLLVYVI